MEAFDVCVVGGGPAGMATASRRARVVAGFVFAAAIPEDGRMRVFHSINDALLTDVADSLGADWVTRAGCVDVSAETPANSKDDFSATIEEVYRWDPDAVICNVAATADEVRSDVKWSSVAAVRAKPVHADFALTFPCLPDGVSFRPSEKVDLGGIGNGTWASACRRYEPDNDAEEQAPDRAPGCRNCLYRRWTKRGFTCVADALKETFSPGDK